MGLISDGIILSLFLLIFGSTIVAPYGYILTFEEIIASVPLSVIIFYLCSWILPITMFIRGIKERTKKKNIISKGVDVYGVIQNNRRCKRRDKNGHLRTWREVDVLVALNENETRVFYDVDIEDKHNCAIGEFVRLKYYKEKVVAKEKILGRSVPENILAILHKEMFNDNLTEDGDIII